jgi:Tfp pilus assembly protein PilF
MRSLAIALVAAATLAAGATRAQTPDQKQRAQIHYRLGWDALRAENWAEAEREFGKAIEFHPRFALAYYGLGKANMGLKNFPSAVGAFTSCRDLYGQQASTEIMDQLARNQRREEQLFELRQLVRDYSAAGQSLQRQAQRDRTVQQLQEMITELERQRARGSTMGTDMEVPAFVSLALGSAHFRAGSMSDAEREYLAAIRTKPDFSEAHNNLAVVYLETGRTDLAEREVTLAEKAGYKVHPQLKADIKARKGT